MILFPNCKINIGLHVVAKRSDGYHNLETVFFPVLLQDALEIVQSDTHEEANVSFTTSGLTLGIKEDDNICVKAYQLLKKDFPRLPVVKIHLHKVIPPGAGLGGGSADGAFMLLGLAKKFSLALSQNQLIEYALQLGSDCPFFIINKPLFAQSRGEVLSEIELKLKGYKIIIVNPKIHIDTAWAFSQIKPQVGKVSLQEAVQKNIEDWNESIVNDFEEPVFKVYPSIGTIKKILYQSGAVYASMSGSGSTVYGIFKKDDMPVLSFPNEYFVQTFIV